MADSESIAAIDRASTHLGRLVELWTSNREADILDYLANPNPNRKSPTLNFETLETAARILWRLAAVQKTLDSIRNPRSAPDTTSATEPSARSESPSTSSSTENPPDPISPIRPISPIGPISCSIATVPAIPSLLTKTQLQAAQAAVRDSGPQPDSPEPTPPDDSPLPDPIDSPDIPTLDQIFEAAHSLQTTLKNLLPEPT